MYLDFGITVKFKFIYIIIFLYNKNLIHTYYVYDTFLTTLIYKVGYVNIVEIEKY